MNDKNFKEFLRSLGCIVCKGPAEIHHIRSMAGMGQKNSDYIAVPLCRIHHTEIHQNTRNEREYLDKTYRLIVKTLDDNRMPF